MKATTEATAVATTPQINGKDIAVHAARTIGSGLHTGFSFLAEASKFATAHIVHKIDNTISVQDTDDYITYKTSARLEKSIQKMSGYKPVIVE